MPEIVKQLLDQNSPNQNTSVLSYTREDVNTVQSFTNPLVSKDLMLKQAQKGILRVLRVALYNTEKPVEESKEDLELQTRMIEVKEVCKRLSISKPTFYKLVRDGKLRIIKLCRASRVPEIDLVKLQEVQ